MSKQAKEINYKEEYEKRIAREKRSYQRRAVKVDLILKKAYEAGITATEKEVDEAYEKKYGKK